MLRQTWSASESLLGHMARVSSLKCMHKLASVSVLVRQIEGKKEIKNKNKNKNRIKRKIMWMPYIRDTSDEVAHVVIMGTFELFTLEDHVI